MYQKIINKKLTNYKLYTNKFKIYLMVNNVKYIIVFGEYQDEV